MGKAHAVLSRICWVLPACLISLQASFIWAENGSLATSTVAFVGCPADGQQGPQQPPTVAAVAVELDPELAADLAYRAIPVSTVAICAVDGIRHRPSHGSVSQHNHPGSVVTVIVPYTAGGQTASIEPWTNNSFVSPAAQSRK